MENKFDEFVTYDSLPNTFLTEKSLSAKKTSKKINSFKNILNRVETNLNESFLKLGLSVSQIKLKNSFSSSELARSISTKVSTKVSDKASGDRKFLNFNLNVNVNKFLNLPSIEVYSIVSALIFNSVYENLSSDDKEKIKQSKNENGEDSNRNFSKEFKEQKLKVDVQMSRFLLKEYLKNFLPTYFPANSFSGIDIDLMCERITENLLMGIEPEKIAEFPKYAFKLGIFDAKSISEARKYIPHLTENRLAKIQENGSKFMDPSSLLDKDSKIEDFQNAKALGAQQQFVALASVFAGKEKDVKYALEGGFNNNNEALKDFCRQYAESFMKSNGLAKINVVFTNGGECVYSDKGSSHEIQIDLNAPVLKGGNVCELIITLSHELTHAVDSSINKINGNVTKQGFGLQEGLDDFSDSEAQKGSEEYKLLQTLSAYCYQLNPDERRGRIGELSAIKFLKNIYSDNPQMMEQLQGSINSFNSYQMKTIHAAEGLSSQINVFENKLKNLNISRQSKTYKMIEERIDFLKRINDGLDVEAEKQSIQQAVESFYNKEPQHGGSNFNFEGGGPAM